MPVAEIERVAYPRDGKDRDPRRTLPYWSQAGLPR